MSSSTKKLPSYKSLTVTLALAFLSISIIVLLVSSLLELYFTFRTQQGTLTREEQFIAQEAGGKVGSFMSEKLQILDQAGDINNLAVENSRRELVLSKLLGRESSFRQLLLLDTGGSILSRASRLVPTQTSALLDEDISSIAAATRQGKNYISPIYIDNTTSEPLILIATPVKDSLHDIKGALIAEVNLKFIWDLVSQIKVGEGGLAYVVDRKGKLLAFKDTSRVLKNEDLSGLPEVHEFVSGEISKDYGIGRGIGGRLVSSDFVPLGVPDWAVMIELPLGEAYAPVLQTLAYSFFVIFLSSILAVISGIYLSRRITGPLVKLDQAAEAVSRGDLSASIPVSTNDEIGHLASSFNSMTTRLRDVYGNLEQKVSEKTSELSAQVSETNRTKLAVLNLLEDVEEEKGKAEDLVTERTRELREEKARLLSSINALSFGFVLAGKDDAIILKNPALASILETERDFKTIHEIAEALKATDSKIDIDISASCQRCMELKQPVEFKEVSYGKKFLRILCIPVRESAEAIGYIFLLEDITEAKVMERSRDEFFAVASHELRTPLTAIRGNADMILEMYADKILDADMKEMLVDINTSSVRLIDVVNDFLEVSRLEQGRVEIKKEDFDVAEVIEKVVRDLRTIVEQKKLTLTYAPPAAPLPHVFADRNRCEQILVNLIGNSTKFTKAGGISISVEQLGRSLKVKIADTGVGISEHNQTLLFRKFQQAGEDMLARDVSQSTGLGLYISRLIMNAMGGDIGLEKSELGKGSVFYFTLPLTS